MSSTFVIGKIRGIEIGINYTWLIALGLITWSLAVGFFPSQFAGWSDVTYWTLSLISALLLFVSVLAHELAHSFVAQSLGMRVQSINLFIFGGVSNIVGEAAKAKHELLISIVGPLSSLALGVLFFIGFWLTRGSNEQLQAVLFYLAGVNALLAVFNLIPGFPLDGGRVLRAAVWAITHSFARSTRIASTVGKVIAYLFIFGGLYIAFSGDFLSGIWLAFIGWFLAEASEASYRQMTVQQLLRGVRVSDIMTPRPITIAPSLPLRQVVDQYILQQNVRSLPVVEADRLVGLLTLGEVRAVPADRWLEVTVRDVMTPLDRLHTVTPSDDANRALNAMGVEDVNQLPVIDDGHVVGLLSRGNLIRFLQVREELNFNPRG